MKQQAKRAYNFFTPATRVLILNGAISFTVSLSATVLYLYLTTNCGPLLSPIEKLNLDFLATVPQTRFDLFKRMNPADFWLLNKFKLREISFIKMITSNHMDFLRYLFSNESAFKVFKAAVDAHYGLDK